MAEYIDKRDLLDRLQRKKAGPATIRYTEGFNDAIMRVRSMVSQAQPCEVAPVVHGKWIVHEQAEYPICSNCHTKLRDTSCAPNYCHLCGAKMDLE